MENKRYKLDKSKVSKETIMEINKEIDTVMQTNKCAEINGILLVKTLYPSGLDEFDNTKILFKTISDDVYRVKRGFQVVYPLAHMIMNEHKSFPIIVTIDKDLNVIIQRGENTSRIELIQQRKK